VYKETEKITIQESNLSTATKKEYDDLKKEFE